VKKAKLEVVRGSGNVFRDFGDPDADAKQLKAILAAEIIKKLDREGLSTRKAQALTDSSSTATHQKPCEIVKLAWGIPIPLPSGARNLESFVPEA
jgi:hypothetical protein